MSVYRPKVNDLASTAYADRSRAALVHFGKEKGAVRSASGLIFIPSREGNCTTPTVADLARSTTRKPADGTISTPPEEGGAVVAASQRAFPAGRKG